MKFGLRELQVLDLVAGGKRGMTGIALALSLRKPNVTVYVRKLARFGLVGVEERGRRKLVSASPGVVFSFSDAKAAFPSLKLSDVLLGRRPFCLGFALEREEFQLRDLNLPVSSAKLLLASLRNLGLVTMKKKGSYSLREEARPLAEFCRQTLSFAYSFLAGGELGALERAVFSFDSAKGVEAVFVTRAPARELGNYWPTGFSAAHEHGLQLVQAGKWYYSNVKPAGVAGVVMHILALDRGARGVSYAAALLAKNRGSGRALLGKRQKFGIEPAFLKGLVGFVNSRGNFDGLDFGEVEALL